MRRRLASTRGKVRFAGLLSLALAGAVFPSPVWGAERVVLGEEFTATW